MPGSFVTPWTIALQAPLSMGFLRQEYLSGLPLLSPEDLPNKYLLSGRRILYHWATWGAHMNVNGSIICNSPTQSENQSSSVGEWINKWWDISTMDQYPAVKGNRLPTLTTPWTNLKGITLRRITISRCYRLYSFCVATATNDHKLSDLNNTKI